MPRQLLDYLPEVLRPVREIKAVLQTAEQPEIEELWAALDMALADEFILTAGINGIRRWEKILHLRPSAEDTLQTRRERILMLINNQRPFSYRMILQYLAAISEDFTLEVEPSQYALVISVLLDAIGGREDLLEALREMIPANYRVLLRAQARQEAQPARLALCAAAVGLNRHRHKPQATLKGRQ